MASGWRVQGPGLLPADVSNTNSSLSFGGGVARYYPAAFVSHLCQRVSETCGKCYVRATDRLGLSSRSRHRGNVVERYQLDFIGLCDQKGKRIQSQPILLSSCGLLQGSRKVYS